MIARTWVALAATSIAACGKPSPPSSSATVPAAHTADAAVADAAPSRRPSSSFKGPALQVRTANAAWDPATGFDHAIDYLAKLYSPTALFDDPYITSCGVKHSTCRVDYRELDHAILLLHWAPAVVFDDPRLARATRQARHDFATWQERWAAAPLQKDAIDLYALVPYYAPVPATGHMLSEIVRGLDANGDWEPYDVHGAPYRKITDELWLILALAHNHVDTTVVARALDRKRDEATRILSGDWRGWNGTERFYALSHIYMAFIGAQDDGYDIARYSQMLEGIETELARDVDDPELSHANGAIAEVLYALAKGGYPDRARLAQIASELAARQQPDGHWNGFEMTPGVVLTHHVKRGLPGFGTAHATLMALAALDQWSRWTSYAAQREWRALVGPPPITTVASGPPPASVFAEVGGVAVRVGYPVTKLQDILFLDEQRFEPENSVAFFRDEVLAQNIARLSHDATRDGTTRLANLERIRTIRQHALQIVPSHRGITLREVEGGWQIDVELELYGKGATSSFAARVQHGIEQAWHGDVDGVRVTTTARVALRGAAPPAKTALPVYVPTEHVMPTTQREGDTGDRPTTWPAWIDERTIAHEMGHYFGFPDAYHVDVRDGFYYLVYDAPQDVMSSPYGAVQVEELRQVVRTYRPRT